jgi:Carboxypeptidase regulatory-like domain
MRVHGFKLTPLVLAVVVLQGSTFGQFVSRRTDSNIKVKGMVRDDAGGSIPGATVTFKTKRLQKRIVSNNDGTFEIDLPAETYRVVAKAEGCREFKLKELNAQSVTPIVLNITVKCPPTPIHE